MIKVTSLYDAPNWGTWADFAVSIHDTDNHKFAEPLGKKQITVRFDDTERPNETDYMNMSAGVFNILNFAKGVTLDHNTLVHCRAGVSRSSAIAWLLLIQMGMDYKEAFTLLWKQHPNIWPNKVVLEIGARELKLGKDFLDFVSQVDAEIAMKRNEFLGYGG